MIRLETANRILERLPRKMLQMAQQAGKNSQTQQFDVPLNRDLKGKSLLGGIFLAVALQVQGGWVYDPYPPVWRGNAATTYQAWDFSTGTQTGIAPSSVSNPFGSPVADITLGSFADGYFPGSYTGTGSQSNYWDIGGTGGKIALTIPTTPGLQQIVNVQFTFFTNGLIHMPDIAVPGATLISSQRTTIESGLPISSSWELLETSWLIDPGTPMTDYVWITSNYANFGVVFESIVVDTMVVPEPATASIFLLGGVAGLFLFRRRNRA